MPSGRVSSASRASRASGIGTSASTPAKLQRPARKSAARKSQDFIVISDDSDFELSASAEAESDAYSAFSAGSAMSSGDEELPEDESAELSSAGEASPRLTLDSRSDSGDDEVATPSDVPSKRQKTEDGYFDTGSDPVVLLPTIASLKSKQASSSQSPLRRAMKQSTLSFGQRKPPQPAPAKAKAKAPAAKERRAATPDFIVDSSDEFISDGDEGAPRKRKQASGSKGAAAGKSKRWAPEFRAGRKVRYLPFVPKYEDAVAMAHAARAKEAAGELPPMSALDDIFGDIVRRLDTDAIVSLAKTLQGRPLRVATMCSGTESPLLALKLISRAIKEQHGLDIEIHHVFACEIEPYKQAYIERNFSPPILFRDVCELGDDQAHTAYGALVDVPGDVDILVAGTSCVDYSGLNNMKKGLNDGGESGRTFFGMLNWVEKHQPSIVILENVKSAPWADVAQAFVDIEYDSAFSNTFDTKNYYIPHTRQRGYLIATRNTKDDYAANWEALTMSMVRPASSSLESFLLPTDDPRIQHVRQQFALGEGFGRSRSTIDWSRCQGRHEFARADEHLGKARPFTAWEEGGGCKLSHDAWNEWALPMPERVLDLLDITTLRHAKMGIDASFKSRVWELSQNVDRNIASSRPGTCGCLTPSGMPYLTSRGGPLVGLEALSLQGLPLDELLLSRETNDQLQNLAGNAMSSTVVGSCVFAALLIAQPDLQRRREKVDVEMQQQEETEAAAPAMIGELAEQAYELDSHADKIDLAKLLESAVASAQRCSCEGRAATSDQPIFQCTQCKHTACGRCKGRPEHSFEPFLDERLDTDDFEAELKALLPMRIVLNLPEAPADPAEPAAGYERWIERVQIVLSSAELLFSGLLRQRSWTAVFATSSGDARLELLLDPADPHWRLFIEPEREEPTKSKLRSMLLHPVARMRLTLDAKSLLDGEWELKLPTNEKFTAFITGGGELVPTWEAAMGIGGDFANTKRFSSMEVKVDGLGDVAGTYDLLPKCGTANGALHLRREVTEAAANRRAIAVPRSFLFLDTDRLRDKDHDSFVFSSHIAPLPFPLERTVDARAPLSWRLPVPNKSAAEGATKELKTTLTLEGRWVASSLAMTLIEPEHASRSRIGASAAPTTLDADSRCVDALTVLSCSARIERGDELNRDIWPTVEGQWENVDLEHKATTTFNALAWLVERVPAPAISAEWTAGPTVDTEHSPTCAICAPKQPDIQWIAAAGQPTRPIENEEQAAPYEHALKNRPPPFVMQLRIEDGMAIARIGVNPLTLMHRALSRLPVLSPAVKTTLSWRLSKQDKSLDEFNIPAYTLRSNRKDPEAPTPELFTMELRPEQRRSLSWMLKQESEDVEPFVEEEVSEGLLAPMRWRAEGKATREVVVRGGVLADAVGYGKTAISLGLIAARKEAAEQRKSDDKRFVHTKATLVIVPPHLCRQWEKEVEKFTGDSLKVVVIHSKQELNKTTIADIQAADIVIMSVTIYKSDAYFESLARLAAANPLPATAGRFFDAALEKSVAALRNRMVELQTKGEGARKVAESVKDKVDFDTSHLTTAKKSKRLIGQAYAEAHAEGSDGEPSAKGKGKAPAKAKAKPKPKRRAADSDSELSDFISDDDEPKRKSKAKGKPKAAAPKASIGPDPWGLGSAAVRSDYTRLHAAPLECFMWERVVIDEFHYIAANAERTFAAIAKLSAHSKWILSGTPPTADFADVKSIATFLNIHLGIDDDADSTKQSVRLRREKARTLVEKFRNFVEVRSPAWHHRRQARGQAFLDQFVRQNVAEIADIPFVESMRPVAMPAAERACYLELAHTIESLDLRLARRVFKATAKTKKKGGADGQNDRDERLRLTVGESSSPEEALSRQAAHFVLDEDMDTTDAAAACEFIVSEREKQRDECLAQLEREIRDIALPQHFLCLVTYEFRDEHNWPLVVFAQNVENGSWGDPECKPKLIELLKKLKCTAGPALSSVKEGRTRYPKLKPKKGYSKEEAWAEEASLRNTTHLLQRLRNEYWARQQSLRYFTRVRDIQRASKSGEPLGVVCPSSKCDKGGVELPLEKIALASTCGHTGCYECVLRDAYIGQCCTPGCNALAKPTSIVKASSLGIEEPGTRYGVKLQRVADLINSLPDEERILLFVQFDGLLRKVADVLEESGVSFVRLTGTSSNRSNQLDSFQSGGDRVLLLNVADESAAGSNLTVANHVIFLSPLITEEAQQYHATMEQARGRAIRFGQTKEVHIHRFVAIDTIDQSTYENREQKTL